MKPASIERRRRHGVILGKCLEPSRLFLNLSLAGRDQVLGKGKCLEIFL